MYMFVLSCLSVYMQTLQRHAPVKNRVPVITFIITRMRIANADPMNDDQTFEKLSRRTSTVYASVRPPMVTAISCGAVNHDGAQPQSQ